MTSSSVVAPETVAAEHPHWRRNLAVCSVGTFTTMIAMTLLLPYLPVYVGQLGVHSQAAVAMWSGVAYAGAFVTASVAAPVWGRLGDRYGRKSMLVRAGFGMAVTTALLGVVQSPWQLVAVRLLVGLAGGYSSGSTILVAAQAPRERSAWALGIVATGNMAGTVVGPLVGGWVPAWIGIRWTFFASALLILVAAVGTVAFVREDRPRGAKAPTPTPVAGDRSAAVPARITLLLGVSAMVAFATTSVEPVLTLVVHHLHPAAGNVAGLAGFVFTATAVGALVSAPRLGRLADRVGHVPVIVGSLATAAVLTAVQATVTDVWALVVLRLLLGLALGGILPSVMAAVRQLVPVERTGRVLGMGVSAQYVGQVLGPITGGAVAGFAPLHGVFLVTAAVLAVAAAFAAGAMPRRARRGPLVNARSR
ncbi:MAG: MFS transporter [Promicromonosporaceae bacterium]|nr:MFS transporter [Promicromonosporaceae bacterium]